ncbi:hypothetical protein J4411_00545 [Candidatus Pacearchaeota archaeon]|nr:hypothetical protein [uncultured archaeon]MBS3084387.1 hypothetical protein [Candidatus Pacearchaeota archaeon]
MEIEPGDILVCTVEKIVGTTVFVEIERTEIKGTIILSEIAAGRIRNLRDYVVPKKVIICKVLRVMKDHIELSLRRVKDKEKKETLEKNKIKKSYTSILKSILKDKTDEIIKKIEEKSTIPEFLEESKKDPSKLKKIAGKEESEKILEILKKQKEKTVSLRKEIKLASSNPNGVVLIKKILSGGKSIMIKYIAAGRYSLICEDNSLKKADQKIAEFIKQIEKEAKENNIEFSYA